MKSRCAIDPYQEIAASIIIPTTCEVSRADFLARAIASIKSQELDEGELEIIVVCNGKKQDDNLLRTLESDPYLRILKLQEGNVSKARHFGVTNARGEFFCFLDDDDELLANSIKTRLKIIKSDPICDVVVSNGFTHAHGNDKPLVSSDFAAEINENLYLSFLSQNWFSSSAPLFRANTIEPPIFDFSLKYFEWTYLFFLLMALHKNIKYDNRITYRRNEDNPLSASKTQEYSFAYPDFLLKMKELNIPPNIKRIIHQKYLTALNTQSNTHLQKNEIIKAWTLHLSCLFKGGWRYFPYTRFLILHSLRLI